MAGSRKSEPSIQDSPSAASIQQSAAVGFNPYEDGDVLSEEKDTPAFEQAVKRNNLETMNDW